MSLKSWLLHRVNRADGLLARGDLPPREPTIHEPAPAVHPADAALANAEHLGAYAALIGAIRNELEHFVVSQLRLHLAIADHDRFLLTAIGVRCPDAPDARRRLQQFQREFKPEQVKRYLAREVIAALPNAASIDLSQFAGLIDADADADPAAGGEYAELLAALREPTADAPPAYQVSLVGRWAETDPAPGATAAQRRSTSATPLAGRRCEFDVEDGDGKRRAVLQSVAPGRRYLVGTSDDCDIRVKGNFASRRHAELWLDTDGWWVADAGSTNGLRVETAGGRVQRSGAAAAGGARAIRLDPDARLVLSANANGNAGDHPWLALHAVERTAASVTPIAPVAAPLTTVTAIRPLAPPPLAREGLTLTARGAAGVQTLALREGALPITVGRSRNQHLVIARIHEAVSGHHLEITALDAAGAEVVVHGDNGVLVDGKSHPCGATLRWQAGQTMLIGGTPGDEPACTLTLSRE